MFRRVHLKNFLCHHLIRLTLDCPWGLALCLFVLLLGPLEVHV
jgi:hypothetical protein